MNTQDMLPASVVEAKAAAGIPLATFSEVFETELTCEIRPRRNTLDADPRADLAGLALSGGGIRSATFCLGFLQGIRDRLPEFDYLSTVSGGGFMGGWLSAWWSRPGRTGFPPDERLESDEVRERAYRALSGVADPAAGKRAVEPSEGSMSAGVDPVHHVRLFANYLTPRKGILSADTWRAVSLVMRNLALTWLTLIPLLFAGILAGQSYFAATPLTCEAMMPDGASGGPGCVGTGADSHEIRHVLIVSARPIVVGLAVFGVLTALWLLASAPTVMTAVLTLVGFVTIGLIVNTLAPPSSDGRDALMPFEWKMVLAFAVAATIVASLFRLTMLSRQSPAPRRWSGLRDLWRNRITAWQSRTLIAIALTLAVLLLSGLGHAFVVGAIASTANWIARTGGIGATVAAVASALFSAIKSAPKGGADKKESNGKVTQWLMLIAPPLVLVLLALYLSFAGEQLLARVMTTDIHHLRWPIMAGVVVCAAFAIYESATEAGSSLSPRVVGLVLTGTFGLQLFRMLSPAATEPAAAPTIVISLAFIAITWVIALGWLVDPNLTSLHNFYKARLTRAYLGASNSERVTQDIAESQAADDMPLSSLKNCERGAPYLIVNTTLNLTGGHDLSTTQRSAASFTLAKRHCGSRRTGYHDTVRFMNDKLTLGTAVAVSGAAASPAMGSQSPGSALSLLMALCNVRLGFWAPTPSHSRWTSPRPRLWWYYLLRESLAQTNAVGHYCYLTDGGHFDNTGAYSLVERGCKNIIIVDCGADPDLKLQDMGNLVRICREDFNAEISLKSTEMVGTADAPGVVHLVKGTIHYDKRHLASLGWSEEQAKAKVGTITWVKPMAVGELPLDVTQYSRGDARFPQQTTADQWFDEAQFESYRRLGEISGTALKAASASFAEAPRRKG